MNNKNQTIFLELVRLGIGHTGTTDKTEISGVDWAQVKRLADEHGLSAIVLDGLNLVHDSVFMVQDLPLQLKLEWIGEVLQEESLVAEQEKAAKKMADLFSRNAIVTYVLKGAVIAECYPKPNHRRSVDMDCYLQSEKGTFDAWSLGNDLIKTLGYEVDKDFYKNSTFHLPGLVVENHLFLTPWRGNRRLKELEILLQRLMKENKGNSFFEGTNLYRPPVMVSALFLIEHAYSHFLHEGLTWRMILDWVMFKKKHESEIDWRFFDGYIDEFGFGRFYDSYCRMGQLLVGMMVEDELTKVERQMLADIWAPLDVHPEGVIGWKGKLALAGNTWRARWKYRYFTDTNWINALWIQTRGVLFEKQPQL